jgi:hypothetical protein
VLISANPALPASNIQELIQGEGKPRRFIRDTWCRHLSHSRRRQRSLRGKTLPRAVPNFAESFTTAQQGDLKLVFSGTLPAMGFLKSGRLKAIAVSGKARLPALPDVPTFTEGGIDGMEEGAWYGSSSRPAYPRRSSTASTRRSSRSQGAQLSRHEWKAWPHSQLAPLRGIRSVDRGRVGEVGR